MYPTVIVKGFSGLIVVLLVSSNVLGFNMEDDGGTEFCTRPNGIHHNESIKRWTGNSCSAHQEIDTADILKNIRYDKNPSLENGHLPQSTRNEKALQKIESRETNKARNIMQSFRNRNVNSDQSTIRGRFENSQKSRSDDAARSFATRFRMSSENRASSYSADRNIRSDSSYANVNNARIDTNRFIRADDFRSARRNENEASRSADFRRVRSVEDRNVKFNINRVERIFGSTSEDFEHRNRNERRMVSFLSDTRRTSHAFHRKDHSRITRDSRFQKENSVETRFDNIELSFLKIRDDHRRSSSRDGRNDGKRSEYSRRFFGNSNERHNVPSGVRNERMVIRESKLSLVFEQPKSGFEVNHFARRYIAEYSQNGVQEPKVVISRTDEIRKRTRGRLSENMNGRSYAQAAPRSAERISRDMRTIEGSQEREQRTTQDRIEVVGISAASSSRINTRSQPEIGANRVFARSVDNRRNSERLREFGNDRRQRQNSDIRGRTINNENRLTEDAKSQSLLEKRRFTIVSSRRTMENPRKQPGFSSNVRVNVKNEGRISTISFRDIQRKSDKRLENRRVNSFERFMDIDQRRNYRYDTMSEIRRNAGLEFKESVKEFSNRIHPTRMGSAIERTFTFDGYLNRKSSKSGDAIRNRISKETSEFI